MTFIFLQISIHGANIVQATCLDFTNQCLDSADSVVTVLTGIKWEMKCSPCELVATGNTVD